MGGRRRFYVLAAALVVVGVLGALTLGLLAASIARSATVTPRASETYVEIHDGGLAVWVRADDIASGSTGADLGVDCSLLGPGELAPSYVQQVPTLERQSAVVDGWHLVALLSRDDAADLAGTSLVLRCEADRPGLTALQWGTSRPPRVLAVLASTVGAFVLGGGVVTVGLLIAVAAWWTGRRRSAGV